MHTSPEYRSVGTSPEGRFRARVDDIDVGARRVYRIDVFEGFKCGENRSGCAKNNYAMKGHI